jgi:hypothetical protein
MIANGSFLRRLPAILDGTQVVQIEALVFSADAIDASFNAIQRLATKYKQEICGAPRLAHVEIFTNAWTIVDCIHVVLQVLSALDYQTPLALAFQENYKSARALRNRMDHLIGNARNVANSKGRAPVFGAISYVCVPDEKIVRKNGQIVITGGGAVMLSTGRFAGGQRILAVNPAGRELTIPVGGFRLEAFDELLDFDEAVKDLRALMIEINDRLEKQTAELADGLSKEHGIPLEKLLANAPGGLSFYLPFELGMEKADPNL